MSVADWGKERTGMRTFSLTSRSVPPLANIASAPSSFHPLGDGYGGIQSHIDPVYVKTLLFRDTLRRIHDGAAGANDADLYLFHQYDSPWFEYCIMMIYGLNVNILSTSFNMNVYYGAKIQDKHASRLA